MDVYIEAKQAEVDVDPENQTAVEDRDAALAQLNQYKMELAKERVERYPNDFGYRFDYGELLFEIGEYDKALEQFQMAQRNPKVRTKCMLSMGRAFNATGKYDMAADQLKKLKAELVIMDELKKSTIYELAGALDNSNRPDEAIEEYKEIYQNDIGYLNVADKINKFYKQKQQHGCPRHNSIHLQIARQ